MAKKKTKIIHDLVPEHIKLSEEEKKSVMDDYEITLRELPKIKKSDPALRHLDVEQDDVIKIVRDSPTAGQTVFYRGVIDE